MKHRTGATGAYPGGDQARPRAHTLRHFLQWRVACPCHTTISWLSWADWYMMCPGRPRTKTRGLNNSCPGWSTIPRTGRLCVLQVAIFFTEKSRRDCYFITRSEEHTSELQSRGHLVCRLL